MLNGWMSETFIPAVMETVYSCTKNKTQIINSPAKEK
jgi:hypothetical protein